MIALPPVQRRIVLFAMLKLRNEREDGDLIMRLFLKRHWPALRDDPEQLRALRARLDS